MIMSRNNKKCPLNVPQKIKQKRFYFKERQRKKHSVFHALSVWKTLDLSGKCRKKIYDLIKGIVYVVAILAITFAEARFMFSETQFLFL
ncbi:MAG: hypothetical protein COT90_02405 [Candidatus Diapherotrites archaeon CG10_big_fil_rev_8_21_14_0_10_31_34]|nr:MAG: hypothetical protein COT90_02405 [Candidatus Diapherotrites archaeon CG10_big_fil_rev_8_21_14_0_10_31_34]